MKKIYTRSVGFFLIITFIVTPISLFPQQVHLYKEEDTQSMLKKYSSYLTEENEIISMRTIKSQHFKVDKNLYVALIYSGPVQFNYLNQSVKKIIDDTTIAAPSSGRVFKDGVNLTKYDNGLRIQNTDDYGCENGYRSWVKFDISSFTDSTNVLWIEQHIYCTELVEDFWDYLEYHIRRIDSEPINANPFNLWTDINDGTAYELDEWVSNPPDWEWCLLDFPAASDFTIAIHTVDWFGLGYMVKCDEDDGDFYAVFKGAQDDLPPYLVIGYNYIVNVEDSEPIKSYTLFQNFPNPFNPQTVIRYQLPVSCYVELKVYDVLGREINTLVREQQSSGVHEIEFNGESLPSGFYIYRLQTEEYVETKKMILLK
jgi:hypothetical protein